MGHRQQIIEVSVNLAHNYCGVRIPRTPYLEPLKVIHVMIKEAKAALEDGFVSVVGRWRHRKVALMKAFIIVMCHGRFRRIPKSSTKIRGDGGK